jgi:hypothetical protein
MDGHTATEWLMCETAAAAAAAAAVTAAAAAAKGAVARDAHVTLVLLLLQVVTTVLRGCGDHQGCIPIASAASIAAGGWVIAASIAAAAGITG